LKTINFFEACNPQVFYYLDLPDSDPRSLFPKFTEGNAVIRS
jgi:hypothetical protein